MRSEESGQIVLNNILGTASFPTADQSQESGERARRVASCIPADNSSVFWLHLGERLAIAKGVSEDLGEGQTRPDRSSNRGSGLDARGRVFEIVHRRRIAG